jgi:hypothetical protein
MEMLRKAAHRRAIKKLVHHKDGQDKLSIPNESSAAMIIPASVLGRKGDTARGRKRRTVAAKPWMLASLAPPAMRSVVATASLAPRTIELMMLAASRVDERGYLSGVQQILKWQVEVGESELHDRDW